MPRSPIIDLFRADRSAGTKARMLAALHRHGFTVPAGSAVPSMPGSARPRPARSALRAALAAVLDPSAAYAVRSSADVEDGPGDSFAGQFATLLDVRGVDGVADAIATVWDSAHAEGPRIRSPEKGQPRPTGADGGDRATDGDASLFRCRFQQESCDRPARGGGRGRVRTRRRTGTAGGDAGALGEPLGRLDCPPGDSALPEPVIREVADGARRIEKRLRTPVDLEWVHDGERLSWVQARRITALQQPDIYSV